MLQVEHLKDLIAIVRGLDIITGTDPDSPDHMFIYMEGDMTLPVYSEREDMIVGEFILTHSGWVYSALSEPRKPEESKYI